MNLYQKKSRGNSPCSFKWSSEARKSSAVHVVIIGFAAYDTEHKFIYEYASTEGEPRETKVENINPYLTNNNDIVILRRKKPICDVPGIRKGNQPTDGGHLILTDEEKEAFLKKEPNAEKYFKRFMGAREFLYNEKRWCLWLVRASSSEIREFPEILRRINKVKEFREKSSAADTRRKANVPSLFREQNNPASFLVIPSTTSESRKYIPIGFLNADVIPSNLCLIMPDADLWHFGILSAYMHMVWVKYTCGRLESRYRYSKEIVYNNYPWPTSLTEKQISTVEDAARAVLNERAKHTDSNLADMYDPLRMPQELIKAHEVLDRAVDRCYRKGSFNSDIERLEMLLGLYEKYISV